EVYEEAHYRRIVFPFLRRCRQVGTIPTLGKFDALDYPNPASRVPRRMSPIEGEAALNAPATQIAGSDKDVDGHQRTHPHAADFAYVTIRGSSRGLAARYFSMTFATLLSCFRRCPSPCRALSWQATESSLSIRSIVRNAVFCRSSRSGSPASAMQGKPHVANAVERAGFR